MTAVGVLQIAVLLGVLVLLTKPLGLFMAKLFQGERTFLHPVLRPLERLIYKLCGIQEDQEQRWTQYAGAALSFSLAGFLFVYAFQRLQGLAAMPVAPGLAFNTAISFVTNTNWQAYTPETTLSNFVQMAALAVQNFVSAAAGIAVAVAMIRGFARHQTDKLGNFWVDLTRGSVYLLLPISLVAALLLCSQGVIQDFRSHTTVRTLEGVTQTIPQGPVASQEAIKMLGTNGGGFFNANSAHPYENPTPLTNLVQLILIFLIPAGLTYTFGRMVGDTRQGWAIFSAMAVMFLAGSLVCYGFEAAANNMEGKETRFGIAASALFATVTTDASCGAVNSALESFTPIGGLVPMFNIQTDEVIFGGVGSGLYGMLLYAIIAVFIAGLMVGRTPEYLGKKIQQKEVKMAMLPILATSFLILVFTAASVVVPFARPDTTGPQGFSEVLYAYSSASENNGSAFAGLNANTPWYNLTLGLAMLFGRFMFIVPLLAVASSLARQKRVPSSSGTFPTHGPLFVGLLVAAVIVVGALTFFPALALGPLVEHFLMLGS